jgi:hypothetical protein
MVPCIDRQYPSPNVTWWLDGDSVIGLRRDFYVAFEPQQSRSHALHLIYSHLATIHGTQHILETVWKRQLNNVTKADDTAPLPPPPPTVMYTPPLASQAEKTGRSVPS